MVFCWERALRFCFDINPILTGKGRLSLPPARPDFLKRPAGPPRMRRCSQPARSGRARLGAALPRSGEQLRPLTVPSGLPRSQELCSSPGEAAQRRVLLPASPGRVPQGWKRGQKTPLPVVPRRRQPGRDFRGKQLLVPVCCPLTPGNSADLTLLRHRSARK